MKDDEVQFLALESKNDSELMSLFISIEEKLRRDDQDNMILLDMDGFFISNSFKSNLIDFLKKNSQEKIFLAMSGVGKGVRKVILQSIDFPIYIAEDREDAYDWFQNLAEIE